MRSRAVVRRRPRRPGPPAPRGPGRRRTPAIVDRTVTELLGAGDLLQPLTGDEDDTVAVRGGLAGAAPERFALLDAEFAQRVLPWPQIAHALLRRSERRCRRPRRPAGDLLPAAARGPARAAAAGTWPRAGGGSSPPGSRLTLPLTHRLLGQLAAAERPSISQALGRLGAGRARHRHAGDWHLHGTLEEQLDPLIEHLSQPSARAGSPAYRGRLAIGLISSASRATRHVLWLTSGLGCDGDSIAMTAATNPSLEDLLRGLPARDAAGRPLQPGARVRDRRRLPARLARRRRAGGSTRSSSCSRARCPNEEINGEGHWAAMGVDPATGQPIPTCDWIDRLAPRAAAVLALGTCAAYGGIPAMRNNPTGAMGLRDYLGPSWDSRLGHPGRQPARLPGAARQHHRDAARTWCSTSPGSGRALDLDEQGRPRRHLRPHGARGLRPRRVRRAGRSSPTPTATAAAWSSSAAAAPSSRCNVPVRGLGERHRRLPQRRRDLHGLHDAGLPRPVHAVHGAGRWAHGCTPAPPGWPTARSSTTCASGACAAVRRRAGVAAARAGAHHRLRATLRMTSRVRADAVAVAVEAVVRRAR